MVDRYWIRSLLFSMKEKNGIVSSLPLHINHPLLDCTSMYLCRFHRYYYKMAIGGIAFRVRRVAGRFPSHTVVTNNNNNNGYFINVLTIMFIILNAFTQRNVRYHNIILYHIALQSQTSTVCNLQKSTMVLNLHLASPSCLAHACVSVCVVVYIYIYTILNNKYRNSRAACEWTRLMNSTTIMGRQ